MFATVIAVLSTLAGALATGLLQQRGTRAEQLGKLRAVERAESIAAVRDLAVALTDHRHAMYARTRAHLAGAGRHPRPAGQRAAHHSVRAAHHGTRSAVTAPLVTVCLLQPDLAARARAAADAAYALRDAQSPAELDAARLRAVEATEDLLAASAARLGSSAWPSRRARAFNPPSEESPT